MDEQPDTPDDPGESLERVDDVFVLRSMFESAEADQYAANRAAARRAEQLADIVDFARDNPGLYVPAVLGEWGTQELELAQRCAAVEAASRMCLSESEVNRLVSAACSGRRDLPGLWNLVREGFATPAHVLAAANLLYDIAGHPGRLEAFDHGVCELALSCSLHVFRRKAKDLARNLTGATTAEKHAQAMKHRAVTVEDLPDNMSLLRVYGATKDVRAAFRSLTSTAKHMAKLDREDRTRDQLRADLAVERLLSRGTGAAVKTKVFVTIPLDRLGPTARASVRPYTLGKTGLNLDREPLIPGEGPVDDATARELFRHATSFTRVITDPVTGVILDMDRRARKATNAQRAWLALHWGTCLRDGCDRLALDADVDHWCQFHGPERGPTNIANLDPLCDPDHAIKDATKVKHRRRKDQSIELEFPTGHRTRRPKIRLPDAPPF